MKTFPLGALVALVGLAWSAAPARADDPVVHRELQGLYNQMVEGLKKKDAAPVETYIAADFVARDQFGRIHKRKELEEGMRRAFTETESVNEMGMTVQRVVMKGDFAVALVNRHLATTIKDPKGKLRPFTEDAVALDIWHKAPDGWRLRRSHGISLQQTLDGKPLKPGTHRYVSPARQRTRGHATRRRTPSHPSTGH